MRTPTIAVERLCQLAERPARRGRYVLYWMQQSQRAEQNHALEYAVQRANALGLPPLVVFGLTDAFPEANLRHYRFMLEGLRETQRALAARRIEMLVLRGQPAEVALGVAEEAALVVCDRGYLRIQRSWRREVAEKAPCAVVEVESDAVVPVEVASGKAEYAARTLRARHRAQWDRCLVDLRTTAPKRDPLGLSHRGLDLADLDVVLDGMALDRTVPPNPAFVGGTRAAKRLFRRFLRARLRGYAADRRHPAIDAVSHMSMYLHFGQISPVWLALAARDAHAPRDDRDAFLEELLIRRELAQNFVWYTRDYDRYACLPAWARATLDAHRGDRRPHVYGLADLEAARTHDRYWNAAMREMRHTGYMHNHMRMYWGKKILEWSARPETGYRVALALNNKYFLDGRDPSSFANVGWCFGLHDRPWPERAIYGTVRSMAASGLERKTDPDAYVAKVDRLVAAATRRQESEKGAAGG